jgi:hypothetical protein
MYRKDKYARDRVMKSARLLLPIIDKYEITVEQIRELGRQLKKEKEQEKKDEQKINEISNKISELRKTAPTDDFTVLDVGCFTQESRKYFGRYVKYVGIDEKAYHRETKVVDLHHGFEPIPCSAALCLETLEHLVDVEDTLESLDNSIQPGGHLVVSLPNEATLFHRIRAAFGIIDAQAFQAEGKHLHLPSLKQSKELLVRRFEILETRYYISPSACGSKQAWVGRIIRVLPDNLHQFLADYFPSLFARGFIFLLKKRTPTQSDQQVIPGNSH